MKILNCEITSSCDNAVSDYGTMCLVDSVITHTKKLGTITVGHSSNNAAARLILENTLITSNGTVIKVAYNSTVEITGGAIQTTISDSNYYCIEIENGLGAVYFHADENKKAPSIVTGKRTKPYSNANCLHGTVIVNGTETPFP